MVIDSFFASGRKFFSVVRGSLALGSLLCVVKQLGEHCVTIGRSATRRDRRLPGKGKI